VKVAALVAGMVAGAGSIEDMDLLCHGGMGPLFAGARGRRRRTAPTRSSNRSSRI
jgi:hypothetical protein